MSMGLICCYSEVDERTAEPASWFEEVSRLDLGLSGGLRVSGSSNTMVRNKGKGQCQETAGNAAAVTVTRNGALLRYPGR